MSTVLAVNNKTRAVALAVRVEHWTPKGDYAERGDKERYRNEWDKERNHIQCYEGNPFE